MFCVVVEFEEEVCFASHDYEFARGIFGDRIEETVETGVVGGGFGVARRGHDADPDALGHEREDSGDDGVGRGEVLSVFVEGYIPVESDQREI